MVLRLLLLLVAASLAPGASEALRVDRELTLAPDAAPLEGYGPALSLEHTATVDDHLSIWAECAGADLVLRLEDSEGNLVVADDDTGGGTNPWVRIAPVRRGERYVIRVAAKALASEAAVRVCIREMPESEASLRAYETATAAFDEALELDRGGDRRQASVRLSAAIDEYCAATEAHESVSFHRTLMSMARQSIEWLDASTYLRASLVRREAMRGLYPPTSEAWAEAQFAVCQGQSRSGDARAALAECDAAFELARASYPPGHVNLAITQLVVAQAYEQTGDLETAYELESRALADSERQGGLDDVRLAMMRGSVAALLSDLGAWNEALELHRKALETIEGLVVPQDDLLLAMRNNYAATLSAMGESSEALAVHEQRCAAYATQLEPDHPEFVLARMNRAIVRLALGRAAQAADELEELVAAQTRTGRRATRDGDSIDVALAEAWSRTKRAQRSLELLDERERLRASEDRRDAMMDWRITSVRAHALNALERRDEALAAAERALQLATRAMPPDSPDLAESRQLVASLLVESGQLARARELAASAAQDAQAYFARSAAALTMRQAEAVQSHWSRLVSDGLSLLQATTTEATRAESDRLAFELTECARGVGTSLLRAWNSRDRAAPEQVDRIEGLRRAVLHASHEVARVGAGQPDVTTFEAALGERTRAEATLREALATQLGPRAIAQRPDAAATARGLAANEALIAYWRQDVRALDANASAPRSAKLLAFVVRKDRAVRAFELGPLAPIAELVERWRIAAASGDAGSAAEELAAGASLRALVLDPLAPALEGANRWRVALDDGLHLVALDALPEGERRIGERIELVTTPICGLAPRAVEAAPRGARLLALGGIDYDASATVQARSAPRLDRAAPTTLEAAAWDREFPPLWETLDEIEGVAKLFRRTHSSDEEATADLLTERDAPKSALVDGVRSATYLHIATHGFFALDAQRDSKRLNALADRSPLTLCGLALSGANDGLDEHGSEGLITADELAALDLSRCELAVLSACDTNVGARLAGQGVASFQKALHAAGAHYVVTSLWKVDDVAAREWMDAFYSALWVDGLPPGAAAQRAKSELRRRRAPVRDWAGWVLSEQ